MTLCLLKANIKRVERDRGTSYVYPSIGWDPMKVVFGPFYEAPRRGTGREKEDIVFGVHQYDLDFFLRAHGTVNQDHHFTVEEISKEEAIEIASPWLRQTERVVHAEAAISALSRIVRGQARDDDYNIIDPENSAIGINQTKTFSQLLDEAFNRFV